MWRVMSSDTCILLFLRTRSAASSLGDKMCDDPDAVPPSITTSVGSVERGDSEEDMLSSSCGRVTLRDDPDPLPSVVHAEYCEM
jgi:hypothetical protein